MGHNKIKDFMLEWPRMQADKQERINRTFKGIEISVTIGEPKPIQTEMPPVKWNESNPKVRAIKATILNNSGIYYTENDFEFMKFGGPMSHFCQAYYCNPIKAQRNGNFMMPSEMFHYEIIAVKNTSNELFTSRYGEELSAERRLSLWFHEFGHATGHATRLNRPVINDMAAHMDERQAAIEELIAEKCAMIGMAHFGMATDETRSFSEKYLTMYLQRIAVQEHEFIHAQTDRDAQAAFDFILNNWLVGLDLSQVEAA